MDNIIESIYRSCDEKNADSVSVSSLIEFITPYMSNDLEELVKLRTQLDPDNTDPHIKYNFFLRVMSDWVANIQADATNNSLSEIPVNLSQTFSSSICDKKSNNVNDNSEEVICNLKLQLNKAYAELDLVKQQLVACEEQNEFLLADLNACGKKQNKEHNAGGHFNENGNGNEDQKEKATEANKQYEQLKRLLSKSERQQQEYQAQINELETENLDLKNKLQSIEKVMQEGRKSLTEMSDCLDTKEAEITTLSEIIETLKCELEEKTDDLSFHKNERQLLKQRVRDLENVLQKNTTHHIQGTEFNNNLEHVFNTPKLLNQLANPITPTLHSPLLKKGFRASSPLKNSSFESENGSCCDFSNTSFVRLRSPHKTIKEELAEIPSETSRKADELDNLYKVVKDQEDIKNSLWQNVKKLTVDNEALLDYQKEYFDLMFKLQEKDELLLDMKRKLETREKDVQFLNVEHVKLLIVDLTNVEDNLKEQKLINTNLQKKCEFLSQTLNREVFETQDQVIHRLSNELKVAKSKFQTAKLLNESLCKKLKIKNTIDQVSQTDETSISWNVSISNPEPTELKMNSFGKQQIKLERLLEKQEKLEKDLSNEKSINTKLSLRCQELFMENEKNKKDLQSCHENILMQSETLKQFRCERSNLLKNLEVFKTENVNLEREIDQLKNELGNLKYEKHVLDGNLQSASSRLAIQTNVNNNLHVENELLKKKQYQLESKIKEEVCHRFNLNKQLTDLKDSHCTEVRQLRNELIERCTEIRTLKKQFEIINIEFFVSSCNEELHRAVISFFECYKSDDDWIRGLSNIGDFQCNNESISGLENEMCTLNANIKVVVSLLKKIGDEYLDFISCCQVNEERSEFFDDDVFLVDSDGGSKETSLSEDESFASCFSDISLNAQEICEIITLESDSFLENLQLESLDYKHVSRKEMEEKFATLALLLTVDIPASKKRSVNEKEKLHQSIFNFFSYLNCSLHLLDKLNRNNFGKNKTHKTIMAYLRQLKNSSEDMLKSVYGCGVLHYEKRTLDCWKFVINYVAILSQQNKQMKEVSESCKKSLAVQSIATHPKCDDQNRFLMNGSSTATFRSCYLRIKFWFCMLILLFVFVVGITFYVDHFCPKYGKRMCPLQWIMSLVIEKTYPHNNCFV